MSKRTRDEDDFSTMADPFSLFSTTDSLGLPDCDMAWAFDTDADPTQVQFSDFGSTDIDTPTLQSLPLSGNRMQIDTHADALAAYQISNGSSFSSAPSSRLTSSSSVLSLSSSSSSPPFPLSLEAQSHTGPVNLCRSLCRSESCLAAALRTLTSLHVAHSACLSAHQEAPSVQQARTMEAVLATNKDIVAGMAPILACSCSGKSLVQLLLSIICGNLIAWNSAMITADLEQGDPFEGRRSTFSSTCSLSSGPGQAPRARVLAQPITIGQHQINGSLGRALRAQVLAGELRVLEGLVDALARRFCEASRSDSTSSNSPATHTKNANGRAAISRDTLSLQSKGLSTVVHRNITSSLRTRLQIQRAKIFSRLGQGD
ncbi:MAG: hypothetical protein HETSPECPRED_007243 [Heterodermia speciosa]|uniref:Aflatoxin regulatory protein domain-containing protein n=1 Tax=Heterodermia speciosa TaxID=116794 RepID=A0A8H3FPU4_9LECA|nr:MAG: hypothetical protein HETSPECPRED_007243 [Heterodermia speciosa]